MGLDPNEVPRRTVNIEIRDSNGASLSNPYSVLQNFFTGYSESYTSTCASTGTGAGAAPQACSGTDSIVTLVPVSNGTLYGNREFQFDKVRGDYQFVVENPAVTPQLVNQIRVRTDQAGKAIVRLRVTNAGAHAARHVQGHGRFHRRHPGCGLPHRPAGPGGWRSPSCPTPSTFQGATTLRCGSGTADVYIFGGVAALHAHRVARPRHLADDGRRIRRPVRRDRRA